MARKTISQDQLDGFSIDDETNQLYWLNKEVMTVISLPWWVQISALAAALSTVALAVVTVADFAMKVLK